MTTLVTSNLNYAKWKGWQDTKAVKQEKEEWKALMSSKEWQSTERISSSGDQRISAILEKVTSLYQEGSPNLEIEDESRIQKGRLLIGYYHSSPSNH